MGKIRILSLIFFSLYYFSCLNAFAIDGKISKDSAIKRMYEFVKFIQLDVVEYPYENVSKFIKTTNSFEGPGEYWTYKLKEETTDKYKISFTVSKLDTEKVFRFSSFRLDFRTLGELERVFHYNEIRTIFLKKFGKPRIDNTKKLTVQWILHEGKESTYYLTVKNNRIQKDKGDLKIFLNRVLKKSR